MWKKDQVNGTQKINPVVRSLANFVRSRQTKKNRPAVERLLLAIKSRSERYSCAKVSVPY